MTNSKQSLGEQYLKEKEEIKKKQKETESAQMGAMEIIIDTMEKLKNEIKRYDNNEPTDFSNVKWNKLVKHKDFTEDMMLRFQVMAQNYYKDFVENHKVSDSFIRKMYYDFLGVFSLSWLSEKDRKRIFPELEQKQCKE